MALTIIEFGMIQIKDLLTFRINFLRPNALLFIHAFCVKSLVYRMALFTFMKMFCKLVIF